LTAARDEVDCGFTLFLVAGHAQTDPAATSAKPIARTYFCLSPLLSSARIAIQCQPVSAGFQEGSVLLTCVTLYIPQIQQPHLL